MKILEILLVLSVVDCTLAQDIVVKPSLQEAGAKITSSIMKMTSDEEFSVKPNQNLEIEILVKEKNREILIENLSISRPAPPLYNGAFPAFEILGKLITESRIAYVYQKDSKTFLSVVERVGDDFKTPNLTELESGISFRKAIIEIGRENSLKIALESAGGRKQTFQEIAGSIQKIPRDIQGQSQP